MLNPLERDGAGLENDSFPDPHGLDRFRWLQWLQLGLSCALVVLFVNQLSEVREVNRRIAGLHQRIDQLEKSRIPNTTAALEGQQRLTLQRLKQLEAAVRDLAAADLTSPTNSGGVPAFQIPPPPPSGLP
jgi:hypothetical protein